MGTNDAHFYSFLGDNLAWQSWVPTYANLTVGNGTVVAKYTQIGKTVFARFDIGFGSTSAMGTVPTVSLPVTANSEYSDVVSEIGRGTIRDSGVNTFEAHALFQTGGTAALIRYINAASTPTISASITSSAPMTWTTGDRLTINFIYEVA